MICPGVTVVDSSLAIERLEVITSDCSCFDRVRFGEPGCGDGTVIVEF